MTPGVLTILIVTSKWVFAIAVTAAFGLCLWLLEREGDQ